MFFYCHTSDFFNAQYVFISHDPFPILNQKILIVIAGKKCITLNLFTFISLTIKD